MGSWIFVGWFVRAMDGATVRAPIVHNTVVGANGRSVFCTQLDVK